MKLFTGVNGDISVESHPELISHTIPCKIDINNITDGLPCMGTLFVRFCSCMIMHKREDSDSCGSCEAFRVESKKKAVRSQQKLYQHLNTPAKPCAPLSKTHRQHVELAFKTRKIKSM